MYLVNTTTTAAVIYIRLICLCFIYLTMCLSPSSTINSLHNEPYIKSRIFGAIRWEVLIMKAALVLFRTVYNICKPQNNSSRYKAAFSLFTFYLSKNMILYFSSSKWFTEWTLRKTTNIWNQKGKRTYSESWNYRFLDCVQHMQYSQKHQSWYSRI